MPPFADKCKLEEFLLVYVTLTSRMFYVTAKGEREICLVPYADMANCGKREITNATWAYDRDTDLFSLVSYCGIKKDQPV